MIDFEEYPLSIEEIFKSLKTMMLKKADDKQLVLNINTAHDIPDLVLGDPTRLNQILINLVNNAIKFTHSGSVTVYAKTVSHDGENIIIEFSVTDTGIGIAEDKHENIFERFHQAESHTTRTYGGSGLGLSISKQLVILQGGEIAVQSKQGVGSIFSFTLPFKIQHPTAKVLKKAALNNIEMNELSRVHILLVEDNAINIKLMLSLFNEQDIKVELAENGRVAIEKLNIRSFDIILMDMEMPEMNGYEAAIFIRKEMKSNVPIIAMTANAMAGEREKCIRFGMNDYLSKPINAEQLFLKIYQLTNMYDPLSENNNLVDLNYLVEMTDGNHETISKIMEIFMEEVPANLLSLQNAITAMDYPSIKKIVHHLKSSVAVLGINPLKSMLQEMELLAGSAFNLKRITELYPSLQELCKRAIAEIEQKIGDYQ
jgi:CheY-like chemotaxis protein